MVLKIWFRRKGHDPCQPLEVSFRVLPSDLDVNIHLTDSRYAAFMDLVRMQYLIRTNLWANVREAGSMAVIGTAYTRFRRELKPFDKFTVKIQLVYMSPKWFYFDYKFLKNGFVHCHSIEKWGAGTRGKGMMPPQKLLTEVQVEKVFPIPPAHIIKIMDAEDEMRSVVRKDS
jgi:acyl-CoA thioesterase FadM